MRRKAVTRWQPFRLIADVRDNRVQLQKIGFYLQKTASIFLWVDQENATEGIPIFFIWLGEHWSYFQSFFVS